MDGWMKWGDLLLESSLADGQIQRSGCMSGIEGVVAEPLTGWMERLRNESEVSVEGLLAVRLTEMQRIVTGK